MQRTFLIALLIALGATVGCQANNPPPQPDPATKNAVPPACVGSLEETEREVATLREQYDAWQTRHFAAVRESWHLRDDPKFRLFIGAQALSSLQPLEVSLIDAREKVLGMPRPAECRAWQDLELAYLDKLVESMPYVLKYVQTFDEASRAEAWRVLAEADALQRLSQDRAQDLLANWPR